MKVKSLSQVQLLVTPWTAAYQAPPSIGFSRQEYWSGVPLSSPAYPLLTKSYWKSQVWLITNILSPGGLRSIQHPCHLEEGSGTHLHGWFSLCLPELSLFLGQPALAPMLPWQEFFFINFLSDIYQFFLVLCCAKSLQLCPTLSNPMEPTRILCPWDSPSKNAGVGCYPLLQGIVLTQGSNLCFLH